MIRRSVFLGAGTCGGGFCRFGRIAGGFLLVAGQRLKRFNAGEQRGVLGACPNGHFANSFEIFALNHIHGVEQPFSLPAESGFDFAANTLRCTGGVGHELGQFIKNAV